MTEDELQIAIEGVRRRGVHGVTDEYIESQSIEAEATLSGLTPDFGLSFSTPEQCDMNDEPNIYRVYCSHPTEEGHGLGEAATPGLATFLAFAEALEVFDLHA